MPAPAIHRFDADTLSALIAHRLGDAARLRGSAHLAVPGGRSPGPILTRLAMILEQSTRDALHLWWVDERAVPRGHADRNDAAGLAAWRAGGADPGHCHPMPAEVADLTAAAARYGEDLTRTTGDGRLDVVLLGIGDDGHIASLFPHHTALDQREPCLPVTDSPKPPPARLTLSLIVFDRARCRQIVATGPAKQPVARRALAAPSRALPCSLLRHDDTHWWLDG